MKTNSFITVIFLLLCNLLTGQVPDSLKYISLRPAEFQQAFNKEDSALLIDVREYFEYKKSRLRNALNIPSSGNLDLAADTLGKEYPLYLYCTSGFRSKRVGKSFYDHGYLKVYSLDGGIKAWKKDQMPVDKKRIRGRNK